MGTTAEKLQKLRESKQAIKAALESKGKTPGENLSGYANLTAELVAIEGVDGKTITGTIPSKTAETIIPTTEDQTIAAGQYLAGAQTIKGDVNLRPENIRKGVTIFGKTGTYGGEPRIGKVWKRCVDENKKAISGNFNKILYANGVWVAFDNDNSTPSYKSKGIYYSIDGKVWAQSNVTSGSFYGTRCHYADGVWVAGFSDKDNNNNTYQGIYYSTDGKSWTQSNVIAYSVTHICYANGIWVAAGNDGCYYSNNGISWERGDFSAPYPNFLYNCKAFCYADGTWVVSGIADVYDPVNGSGTLYSTYYSTDCKNWTQIDITNDYFNKILYANGVWVASGSRGIYYSTDGKVWTQSNITTNYFSISYHDIGVWTAVGISSYYNPVQGIYYSTDGKTWVQSNITTKVLKRPEDICGMLITGGVYPNSNALYYSTDGEVWKQGNGASGYVNTIRYANGVCVISLGNGGLYYSVA